jgi:hypothetical protein
MNLPCLLAAFLTIFGDGEIDFTLRQLSNTYPNFLGHWSIVRASHSLQTSGTVIAMKTNQLNDPRRASEHRGLLTVILHRRLI